MLCGQSAPHLHLHPSLRAPSPPPAGNPDPADLWNLATTSRRIFDPAATDLELSFDAPQADVALRYDFTLTYFPVFADLAYSRTVTGSVDRDDVVVSGASFLLRISLPSLDCDPDFPDAQPCGAGR